MRIAIIGYSGSGKSTLAAQLGQKLQVPVLHLDSVHWLPGWVERPREEEKQIVRAFLDEHDAWVIDGNYSKLEYSRRMEEADKILLLLFPPLASLYRVTRRYLQYRDTTRPDMAAGCQEKLDWEFVKWVLRDGRSKRAKARYRNVIAAYPEKTVVLKSQRQIDAYLRQTE